MKRSMQKKGKPVSLEGKRLAQISLSHEEFSVVMGGLLGDGSLKIYRGYKNARYSFRHSIKQAAYFQSKCQLLGGISSERAIFPQPPDGFSRVDKLRYQSRALPALTEIHSVTHRRNKIRIRRCWLHHLTPLALVIWWLDDGSIVAAGRQGCLSTDGFTESECKILARYLLVVWKVKVRVSPVRGPRSTTYYRLYFSTNQLKSFLAIILPHLPCAEMAYKFHIRYKNDALQQRWISYILNNCPPLLRDHINHSANGGGSQPVLPGGDAGTGVRE